MTRSNWRSVVSSTPVRVSMPALLTMMSSRPKADTVLSTRVGDVGDAGDITLHDLAAAAGGLHGLQRGLRRGLVLVIVDGHGRAFRGQLQDDGVADATVTPGDDGDLVLEQHDVGSLSLTYAGWLTCRSDAGRPRTTTKDRAAITSATPAASP